MYKYFLILAMTLQTLNATDAQDTGDPWKDMPSAQQVYKNFYGKAPDYVTEGLKHDVNVCGALSQMYPQHSGHEEREDIRPAQTLSLEQLLEKIDPIVAHSSQFRKLKEHDDSIVTAVTFKNVKFGFTTFAYRSYFSPNSFELCLSDGLKANAAWRTIVPSFFRSTSALAGPKGVHEWLIQGRPSKHEPKFPSFIFGPRHKLPLFISFVACSGAVIFQAKPEEVFVVVSESPDLKVSYQK